MANKRVFYPCQQVAIRADGTSTYHVLHGVQSVQMTTNFTLEQAYQLGQSAIYQNIEAIPEVEVQLSKILDGYALIYHEATIAAPSPTLLGRSNEKCLITLGIFSDTADSASGAAGQEVDASGMFMSSVRYNFGVEGFFTEECTFQGNNKVWANDPKMIQVAPWSGATTIDYAGQFASNDDAPIGLGGVNRRQNLILDATVGTLDSNGQVADPDCTILPYDIAGISSSGTNDTIAGDRGAHLQSIAVSVDFNREAVQELGRRGPYHRFITPPIQVSCEVSAIATSGDLVSATELGILTPSGADQCGQIGNLSDRTIRIATCEGTRIYLGKKNKLSSQNYSGGGVGGGNVEVSYSFITFNDFTVLHSSDPNASGSTWWTNRADYLT